MGAKTDWKKATEWTVLVLLLAASIILLDIPNIPKEKRNYLVNESIKHIVVCVSFLVVYGFTKKLVIDSVMSYWDEKEQRYYISNNFWIYVIGWYFVGCGLLSSTILSDFLNMPNVVLIPMLCVSVLMAVCRVYLKTKKKKPF